MTFRIGWCVNLYRKFAWRMPPTMSRSVMPPMRNPLTTPSQPRDPYSNALLHRHSHRSQPLLVAGKASLLALALAAPGMVMADSRLESVYFQQADSGEVRLNLEFDDTPPEIGGYRLDNPPRLTLDLMETRSGLEQNEFSVGLGGVESITAREAGERTRLVVEMARHRLNTSVLEGMNNRIKVIKRMAYGYRDTEYFFLKIRAAFPGKMR